MEKENEKALSAEEKEQAVIKEFIDIMCSCSVQREGPVYTLPLLYMGTAAKRIFRFMSGYHYSEMSAKDKRIQELESQLSESQKEIERLRLIITNPGRHIKEI